MYRERERERSPLSIYVHREREREYYDGEREGVREREREREREKGKIQCLKDFLSHLYFIYRVVSPPNAGEPATITMQITPRNATTKSR